MGRGRLTFFPRVVREGLSDDVAFEQGTGWSEPCRIYWRKQEGYDMSMFSQDVYGSWGREDRGQRQRSRRDSESSGSSLMARVQVDR